MNTYKELYVGWKIKGEIISPIYAYTNKKYWLDAFIHQFPEKGKQMKEYDKKNGFTPVVFYKRWIPVVIEWLNKNDEST